MIDYTELADLAAQAVWEAASEEDPGLEPWMHAPEVVKTAARDEMMEFVQILYPVFFEYERRNSDG